MAGLLAAQDVMPGEHGLQHVPVTDGGLDDLDARVVHRQPEPEIRHDRDHHGVTGQPAFLLELGREDGQNLVAVYHLAVGIDRQAPVGVTIVRDTRVGALRPHGRGHGVQAGRPAALVDVMAVGFHTDRDHLGASAAQCFRRHGVGGAVGTVHDNPQARQRRVSGHRVTIQRSQQMVQVTLLLRLGVEHAPEPRLRAAP